MKGLRNVIWQHVVNQVYERSVGPNVDELKKYEAFSDNVYGELLPGFMGTMYVSQPFSLLFFFSEADEWWR